VEIRQVGWSCTPRLDGSLRIAQQVAIHAELGRRRAAARELARADTERRTARCRHRGEIRSHGSRSSRPTRDVTQAKKPAATRRSSTA
jgi:hypothetical protein